MNISNNFNMKFVNILRLPVQVFPSPENPLRHSHVYDPIVLMQAAFSSHEFCPRHSSTSLIEYQRWKYINMYIKDRKKTL